MASFLASKQENTLRVDYEKWLTLLKNNDLLDYRAIILTNTLRKWGVLPPDKNIYEMDEKQYKKFYHQIADLYIFGNYELINIIYNKYRRECLTLHGPPHNDLQGWFCWYDIWSKKILKK